MQNKENILSDLPERFFVMYAFFLLTNRDFFI